MASAAASTRVSRDASTVATIRLSPGSMPIRMPRLWAAHNDGGPGGVLVKVPATVTAIGTAFLLALTMLMALPGRAVAAAPGLCSSPSHAALAARISRGIEAARHGRESFVAVEVDDAGAGIVCRLDSGTDFDSA